MPEFIQTSDIHIGECRSLHGYLERHRGILEQITNLAKTTKLPLVVAGDLFHAKNTTHEERLLATWWLMSLEQEKIPTILTSGNHDHLYGESYQTDLYKALNLDYVKVVSWEPELHVVGDIGFISLSWRGYKTEEIEEVVLGFFDRVSHLKYKVVILHECLFDAIFDNGVLANKGPSLPAIPWVTYWVVGDIHKQQGTKLPNGFYSGAPAMFKFEDVRAKGVLKVCLDNPQNPKFIELKSKPLLKVSSSLDIKEDAYYKVEGDLEEVLEANKNPHVVQTRLVRSAQVPTNNYKKTGITDGLVDFLAGKGVSQGWQSKAVEWVNNTVGVA